jgi:hypothetical protein
MNLSGHDPDNRTIVSPVVCAIGKQLMGRLGFILRLLIMVSVVLAANIVYAMSPVAIIEQTHTLEIGFPTATNITDKASITRYQPEI